MDIGLIDEDGHNFPNLCLMKIAAYHKARGDNVEWWYGFKRYDIVYKSRIFNDEYSNGDNTVIDADEVITGGTGYDIKNRLPDEMEHIYPDYSLYPAYTKDTAYGFLTRGCPRNCPFCIVSQKEGVVSQKAADLNEFWYGQKNIKLLDPNILACKDHMPLLQQLIESKAWIDITQGLDARFINKYNAKLLADIKLKMVHFAFDQMKDKREIIKGLELFKEITGIAERKTGVYILTNYNTTHEEDLYRAELVRDLGYMPYIMIFNKSKAPKITKRLQRWANNRFIYMASNKTFENYK